MKFQEMIRDRDILDALHKLKWEEMTAIQEAVFPLYQKRKNIVIQAKTGSGKTGAYLLPMLSDIDWKENHPQCIILSPTRELACQIKEEALLLGKYKRVKCTALIGKEPMAFQLQDLKQKTHIISGTPGRVLEHLMRGSLCMDAIRYVILDEADEMCKMGFLDDIENILTYCPQQSSYCLCSATMTKQVYQLCQKWIPAYETVIFKEEIADQLNFDCYEISSQDQLCFLWKLLLHEAEASTMIFCNTRETCMEVYHFLNQRMKEVVYYHGALSQKERETSLHQFRYGEAQILVASDIGARGLDIEQISCIIHYELPMEKERFLHRCGRSGRNRHEGHVIVLTTPKEDAYRKELEAFYHISMHQKDASVIYHQSEDENAVQRLLIKRKVKERKGSVFQKEVLRLYIHAGKKKKIRAGDIVGAICQIHGVTAEDIGIIEVQDYGSYVEILHGKGMEVYDALQHMTIKNRPRKVEISHHQI